MHILFVLLFALSCFAAETVTRSSASKNALAQSIIEEEFSFKNASAFLDTKINSHALSELTLPQNVRLQLAEPRRSSLVIDYGNWPISKKLEEVTLDLLQYQVISNIVTAFNDPILLTRENSRIRFTLNVSHPELKFSYSF